MGYTPALDEGELHRLNIRSVREWIERNEASFQGKALLQKKIAKYGAHFDRRYTELLRLLGEEKARLKRR